MRRLILVRHAESVSNVARRVSGEPPGEGLTPSGVEQARRLAELLAGEEIGLGVSTELRRTRETLESALAGRRRRVSVLPALGEIRFGAFEGGPLSEYRAWAWTTEPGTPCPGGGETRTAVAVRVAGALDELLQCPEETVLAVSHALPIRYVLDAADGLAPRRRLDPVAHAEPHRLDAPRVAAAAAALRAWAGSRPPRFRDVPSDE